jgi:hypothetical protein
MDPAARGQLLARAHSWKASKRQHPGELVPDEPPATSKRQCSREQNLTVNESAAMDLVWGLILSTWGAQVMYSFVTLGMPELLAQGAQTCQSIAKALGAAPERLARILCAASELGLCTLEQQKEGHPYYKANQVSKTLAGHGGAYWSVLHSLEPISTNAWNHLSESLQSKQAKGAFALGNGGNIWEHMSSGSLAGNTSSLRFHSMMSGLCHEQLTSIVSAYDFSLHQQLIDVGGGHGILAQAIATRFPSLSVTCFDTPRVVEAACSAGAGAAGADNRVRFLGGSMFVKVPPCDCAVLKHVLQDWGDEEAVSILRVCSTAIGKTGTVVVIESVLGDVIDGSDTGKNTEPDLVRQASGESEGGFATAAHALVDVNAMVMCSGRSRPMAAWHRIAAEAGLNVQAVMPTKQLGPSVFLIALRQGAAQEVLQGAI